jgi:GDPmannose 4,6-dehydratase
VLLASSAEVFGASTEHPQTETTPVHPASPYGAAKAYALHLGAVHRGAGMHVSSAILYNHESPRRPDTFVTRKITSGAVAVAQGRQSELRLGNLAAVRDWGWAPDYVDAMLRMVLADEPADHVVATGQGRTVEDFVAAAFAAAGVEDWRDRVVVDERYFRPVEGVPLVGDATAIAQRLGWRPTVAFEDIVASMVEADLRAS